MSRTTISISPPTQPPTAAAMIVVELDGRETENTTVKCSCTMKGLEVMSQCEEKKQQEEVEEE